MKPEPESRRWSYLSGDAKRERDERLHRELMDARDRLAAAMERAGEGAETPEVKAAIAEERRALRRWWHKDRPVGESLD